jgi:hypothetical protein
MNRSRSRSNGLKVKPESGKIADFLRRIYRICLKSRKEKPEDVNMSPVGLGIIRILNSYAPKFFQTLQQRIC